MSILNIFSKTFTLIHYCGNRDSAPPVRVEKVLSQRGAMAVFTV